MMHESGTDQAMGERLSAGLHGTDVGGDGSEGEAGTPDLSLPQQCQALQAAQLLLLQEQLSGKLTKSPGGNAKQPDLQVPVSVAMTTSQVLPPQVLRPHQFQVLFQQQQAFMLQQVSAQQVTFQKQLLQAQQQHLLNLQRQGLLTIQPGRDELPLSLTQSTGQADQRGHMWKESKGRAWLKEEDRTIGVDPLTIPAHCLAPPNHPSFIQHGTHPLEKESAVPDVHSHPLYAHGTCKWPGCEAVFGTFPSFLKHLNKEHTLDDRSTAQCRVQMQVVQQLELQLAKDRERLQAMMRHLHVRSTEPKPSPQPLKLAVNISLSKMTTLEAPPPLNLTLTPSSPPGRTVSLVTPASTHRRHSHKYRMSAVSPDIVQNKEFYMSAEIRPPFTYASLIRQAILESSEKQLTLNEIYNWFTGTFAYFRRNAATWKNAVRHNLSLHKCFVRVETDKGAVWTVDELEFHKRRPQKICGSPLMVNNKQPGFSPALSALEVSVANKTVPLCATGSLESPVPNLPTTSTEQEEVNGFTEDSTESEHSPGPSSGPSVNHMHIKVEKMDSEDHEGPLPHDRPDDSSSDFSSGSRDYHDDPRDNNMASTGCFS